MSITDKYHANPFMRRRIGTMGNNITSVDHAKALQCTISIYIVVIRNACGDICVVTVFINTTCTSSTCMAVCKPDMLRCLKGASV